MSRDISTMRISSSKGHGVYSLRQKMFSQHKLTDDKKSELNITEFLSSRVNRDIQNSPNILSPNILSATDLRGSQLNSPLGVEPTIQKRPLKS